MDSDRLPLGHEIDFLCYMHFMGAIRMEISDRLLGKRMEVTLFGR